MGAALRGREGSLFARPLREQTQRIIVPGVQFGPRPQAERGNWHKPHDHPLGATVPISATTRRIAFR